MALIIFTVGLMYFLAKYLSLTFTRTKIPDVLVLMAMGIVVGPVLGIINIGQFGAVVLASLPASIKMPGFEMIESITYAVVFLSILVSSVTIALVENKSNSNEQPNL